ncbi:MAG TPA: hypothetical protein VNK52_04175 [Hyphomicrobiaceae bacterium]|nr:hypothetical protein [Hyphomicrobiaceae bacterium]
MTHPDVLQAAAIVIYGERWKAPLARDLGVAPRQLYDWLEGRTPVPLRVWIALSLALSTHARQAIDLLQQLEEIEVVEASETIDPAFGDDPDGVARALCPRTAARHPMPMMLPPDGS